MFCRLHGATPTKDMKVDEWIRADGRRGMSTFTSLASEDEI